MAVTNYFKVARAGFGLITKHDDVFPFDDASPAELEKALRFAYAWATAQEGRITIFRKNRHPLPSVGALSVVIGTIGEAS